MHNPVCATGSCNCGAVTFSVYQSLAEVYICHCSICRKSTGSGGIAVTIVEKDNIDIKHGCDVVQTWHKPGHDWLTQFCKVCGSPLPGKNDDSHVYIPVSLLDSRHEHLHIGHHLFVDSKATWEELDTSAKQHAGQYKP